LHNKCKAQNADKESRVRCSRPTRLLEPEEHETGRDGLSYDTHSVGRSPSRNHNFRCCTEKPA
jgi:hypothetical protein